MKNLFIITSFVFFLASCNSTTDNNALVGNVDSTEVLSRTKEKNEIFSSFELDSIYKNLKASPLQTLSKQWEMLTLKNKEWIVLIPGDGENTRFSITERNNSFVLTLNGMQDMSEYLIVGCTQSRNKTIITYYTSTTWIRENYLDEFIKGRDPIYTNLVMEETPNKEAVMICNYPNVNTYYVNAAHVKDFKREVEPNPYDEAMETPVDSAAMPAISN